MSHSMLSVWYTAFSRTMFSWLRDFIMDTCSAARAGDARPGGERTCQDDVLPHAALEQWQTIVAA
jgi:hypothetical protein